MKKILFWSVPLIVGLMLWTILMKVGVLTWIKTYEGTDYDEGKVVQQTSDSVYIVTGETSSFGAGSYDVWLIRAISSSDTLWTKTYGGTDYDEGLSVQPTTDGGYIIAGLTSSFGAGLWDVWLIKTNSSGDTVWTKTYGGAGSDGGESVQQTSDGGYIVAGWIESFAAGTWDVWLIKTDSLGDTLWTKTYGGTDFDVGWSVQQTPDGGYIISGGTESFGAGASDVWLIKTDSLGDTLWTKTYGGRGSDVGHSVQQTSDGGYVIAGYKNSFGTSSGDLWLIKTNSSGDTVWTKTYGEEGSDGGHSVQQTSDGGYIIAGYKNSFGTSSGDVWLLKTDSLGDTLWTKTYGGADFDVGWSVQQTPDGGYIIAGGTESFDAGLWDVWLIKTISSGDTVWTKTYGGTSGDAGHSVQQTSDGGYIIAGYKNSFGAGSGDVWLIKTDSLGF